LFVTRIRLWSLLRTDGPWSFPGRSKGRKKFFKPEKKEKKGIKEKEDKEKNLRKPLRSARANRKGFY
jgi:hypothetical protein